MLQRNRIVVALAALMMLAIAPAHAGDRALVEVIGYSDDGRYFAFEEFGIQDGSGFAYSTIYAVDLTEDRWVVGTPIALQASDEEETLFMVRQRAQADAAPRLADLQISRPAHVVALNGDGVPEGDRQTISFGVPGYVTNGAEPGPVVGTYNLALETFPAETSLSCRDFMEDEPKGYSLTISDFGASRLAHRDRALPRSRGCPTAYAVYGVYLPFEATDISRAVALVSVFAVGFEGPDRRFVAVPLAFTF